jgi:hypothetical protein
VERRDDGDGGATGSRQGGDPAHPVMGVDDIGRAVAPCDRELVPEVPHQGREVFLGQFAGRASRHVSDLRARGEGGPGGLACGGAPGVDGDLVPPGGLGGGQRADVDVLPAGVGAANVDGERAGVLVDMGDHQGEFRHRQSVLPTICY